MWALLQVNALGTFRSRSVLEGSVPEVRQTSAPHRVNLARARVRLGSSPGCPEAGQAARRAGPLRRLGTGPIARIL